MNALVKGYKRQDGSKGFRSYHLVVCTTPCVEGLLRQLPSDSRIKLIVHRQECTRSRVFDSQLRGILANGNIVGASLVTMGCDGLNLQEMRECALKLDVDARIFSFQELGSPDHLIEKILEHSEQVLAEVEERVALDWSDVILGLKCGGSDYTSDLISNPFVGRICQALIDRGARIIVGEPAELIGLESQIAERCISDEVYRKIRDQIDMEIAVIQERGDLDATMVQGNFDGGLTTIEEKAASSFSKFSNSMILDALSVEGEALQVPGNKAGVYFQNGTHQEPQAMTLMAGAGAHGVLFSTGRGGVFNHPVAPIFSFCGNSVTAEKMPGLFDSVLNHADVLDELSLEKALNAIAEWLSGRESVSENLRLDSFDFYYGRSA